MLVKSYSKFKEKKTYFIKMISMIKWILNFYFSNFKYKTIIFFVSDLVLTLKSLVYAYFIGTVIDNLIKLSTTGGDFASLYPYLIFLFAYTVIADVIFRYLRTYAYRSLNREGRVQLDKVYYSHLSFIGIQKLEDPDVQNVVSRSRDWLYDSFFVLEQLSGILSSFIQFIISIVIIYKFFPILIPVFIIFAVIRFFPERYYDKKDFDWQTNDENSEGQRIARRAMTLLQDPKSLNEITVTNAFDFFDKKYTEYYNFYTKELVRIIRNRSISGGLLSTVDAILNTGAYAVIFAKAISGSITVGTVAFYMRAVDNFVDSIADVLSYFAWISEFTLKMQDLIKFFEIQPAIVNKNSKSIGKLENPPSIEFKNVHFKYPKAEKWVFEGINFKINAGEKVAIVGHNGAGKTTLIKLLTRFYDPDEGEILLNGENIKNIKLDDLYKNLGVLFQDYNFYQYLSLKENILVGDISKEPTPELLDSVVKQSDVISFIDEYKHGYDQLMSEQLKEGIRPSTGQQQKIAIARFFYRNAPLAIFDEPTSAIDAVSEYKIFNEIYKYFKNKTVIIVSHRFSTVRNADRIVVLNNGKLAEQGTHEELLAKGRIYAHAFKLQAEGYR